MLPNFDGFKSTDLEDTIADTQWRKLLGKVVAQALSEKTGRPFRSWGIARSPRAFIAPLDWFEAMPGSGREEWMLRAKLYIEATSGGLHYGYYIERGHARLEDTPNHPEWVMAENWDWHPFVAALKRTDVQESLKQLIEMRQFRIGDRAGWLGQYATAGNQHLQRVARQPKGKPAQLTWPEFYERLGSIPGPEWVNLYIDLSLPVETAIARGANIADDIVAAFVDVMPILEAAERPHGHQLPPDDPSDSKPKIAPTATKLSRYWEASTDLRFSPLQIATFITALQTKGFVILSGISGTGKTRLAQEFARLLMSDDETPNHIFLSVRPDWRDSKSLLGYHNPLTGAYESSKLLRFILDSAEMETSDLASWLRLEQQGARVQTWLNRYEALRVQINSKTAAQLSSNDLDRLWREKSNGVADIGQATGKLPEEAALREATDIVMDLSRSPGQRFMDAIEILQQAQPGNSRHWARVWRAMATYDPAQIHTITHGRKMFKLLRLLGYDAPRSPVYLAKTDQPGEIDRSLAFIMSKVDELTPGADTLTRSLTPWLMWEYYQQEAAPGTNVTQADSDERSASFVILDEMNLARVEYYFADFLSVLESGRNDAGLTREAVHLHSAGSEVVDREGHQVPGALRLAPNMYVVGTVNVDETTHSFSPKVLDRAFTIEFDKVDLHGYPASDQATAEVLTDDDREQLLADFTRGGRYAQIEKTTLTAFSQQHPDYANRLQGLATQLEPYGLNFGYRVVDEILMFLANAKEYAWFDGAGGLPAAFDDAGGLAAAFDSAVLMKVLPKFHGPRSRLEDALWSILVWAGLDPDEQHNFSQNVDNSRQAAFEALKLAASESQLPRVAAKCVRMLYGLYSTGFASFG